jgi:hypothetical protein
MDILGFDTSSIFPSDISINQQTGSYIATVGGTDINVITAPTSAPSGATRGYPAPIAISFTDWLQRGHSTPFKGVILSGWMLVVIGIGIYYFVKKRKV